MMPSRQHETRLMNEVERQDDEQQHDSAHQHQDGERPPQIASEGDVAETQGAHHRESPIDTREPGMLLVLVGHQEVKYDREENNDHS